MKKNHLYLLAAGVGAYLLYTKSKKAAAASAVAATVTPSTAAVAGALGATMTDNSMLAELGSLGDGRVNGYKLYRW